MYLNSEIFGQRFLILNRLKTDENGQKQYLVRDLEEAPFHYFKTNSKELIEKYVRATNTQLVVV